MSKEKRKEIEDRDESDPVPEDVTRFKKKIFKIKIKDWNVMK